MNLYLDTSALLRLILREPHSLDQIRSSKRLVSSELLIVEGRRTIDRLRLAGALTQDEAATRLRSFSEWLDAIDLVLLRTPVLARASEPLPVPLGTLDALHLATALTWRDRRAEPLTIATHDAALGSAARVFGFEVLGS